MIDNSELDALVKVCVERGALEFKNKVLEILLDRADVYLDRREINQLLDEAFNQLDVAPVEN